MKDDQYKVKVHCTNCGTVYEDTLAKGVLVENIICDNCGCKTLETVSSPTL